MEGRQQQKQQPPQQQQQSQQAGYVTVYSCDVCSVATFPTLEEAEAHEARCRGPAATRPPQAPSDGSGDAARDVVDLQSSSDGEGDAEPRNESGNGRPEEELSGRPLAAEAAASSEEPTRDDTAGGTNKFESTDRELRRVQVDNSSTDGHRATNPAHKDADAAQENVSSTSDAQQADDDGEMTWNCDVCKQVTYKYYDDAVAHENQCKGPKPGPEPADFNWRCNTCNYEVMFKFKEDLVAHKPLCRGSKQSANPNAQTKEKPDFSVATSSATATAPASSPPKSVGPNSKKITLLSPILNPSDIANNNSNNNNNQSVKLSSHFSTVLSSLDLLYHPYSALVSFKCHYCSAPLPTSGMSWNLARAAEVLPNMATKHLTADDEYAAGCNAAPKAVAKKLRSADGVESSRVRSFEAFLRSFFAKSGVAERRADGRLAYGAALAPRRTTSHHSGERRESPAKKRRGSDVGAGGGGGGGAEKSPPKRVKDGAVYPPSLKVKIGNMGAGLQMDEQKNQFYLTPCAPLDGVPLVSSLSSDRSKELPPPLQSLLQQIEFFNLSSLALASGEKAPPPHSVGIRCQNCVSGPDGCGFVRLASTEELPSDLIAMAADHLVHCRCTEPSARARLKGFAVQDPKPFEEYCRRISKMYGLEDSTSNNVSVVVWGECPSIPSGYFGSPKNIDVDFALDLSHSTEEKEKFSSRSGTEVSSSALLATEKAGA